MKKLVCYALTGIVLFSTSCVTVSDHAGAGCRRPKNKELYKHYKRHADLFKLHTPDSYMALS